MDSKLKPGPWITHDNLGPPKDLKLTDIVEAEMSSDRYVLQPMEAGSIDWSHQDSVARYRVWRP